MKHLLPLLALLSACSVPTYELDEPISGPETFECGGYSEDLGSQYYYNAAILEDGSVFVSGAVSNGDGSSSGTHFYASGETLGSVTVYKEGWVTMGLVLLPETGVQFSTEERNWVQLGGCQHTFH